MKPIKEEKVKVISEPPQMVRIGDFINSFTGTISERGVKTLLGFASDVPSQENITGVQRTSDVIYGSTMGKVIDWDDFMNMVVKKSAIENFSRAE